ncbi:hypothetical protein [Lewinella sp. W8]|uniref:hypothetical protein n=1 Tax=Lewinella sp. W8 TaxID=2528208 RepID=UPI001067AB76|nr:hypothetical protein [Lewinella sp. W8]MTB51816.1 hypothetical protein [Lewinella sp. W8]
MRTIFSATGLLLLCFLVSCQGDPQPSETAPAELSLEEAMLGTWETIEIEVHSPTYQGGDTAVHQLIKEADWGRVYGVQPSRTVFTPDGKLKRTHKLSDGQMAGVINGLWKVTETDSLFIIEPEVTYTYAPLMEEQRLTLRGVVDYDFDGEKDDEYRSVMRLVSRTSN